MHVHSISYSHFGFKTVVITIVTWIIQLYANIDLVISVFAIQISNISNNAWMTTIDKYSITQHDGNMRTFSFLYTSPVGSFFEDSFAWRTCAGVGIVTKWRYTFIALYGFIDYITRHDDINKVAVTELCLDKT